MFRFINFSNEWCFAERTGALPSETTVDPPVCRDVRWRGEQGDKACLGGRGEDEVMSLFWKLRTEAVTGGMRHSRGSPVSQGPSPLPAILPPSISAAFLCPETSPAEGRDFLPWSPIQECQSPFFRFVVPKLWSPSALPFLALKPRPLETSTSSLPLWQLFWPLEETL